VSLYIKAEVNKVFKKQIDAISFISFKSHIISTNSFLRTTGKRKNTSNECRPHNPHWDTTTRRSVIRAPRRPPGGSITVHHGTLAPPREQSPLWVCGGVKCMFAREALCMCVRGSDTGQYVGDWEVFHPKNTLGVKFA